MEIKEQIKKLVEVAIPLNPICQVERTEQIKRRVMLRISIEELVMEKIKEVTQEHLIIKNFS